MSKKKKLVADNAEKIVRDAMANTEFTSKDVEDVTNVLVNVNATLGQRGSTFGYVMRAEKGFGIRLYKATWPDLARGYVKTNPVATGIGAVKSYLADEVKKLKGSKDA